MTPATPGYANAVDFLRALSRLFFRRVEVAGLHNLPKSGGGLLVAWHPNGVIDPVLIATQCPRTITFGARDGLFAMPLMGALLRAVGAVPIYRAADSGADNQPSDEASRRERNRQSLDALARAIADGSLCALFPEGKSHDAPHLAEIKHGAAKLYHRAVELMPAGAPLPAIVPVGLHYDEKSVFRSRALVYFHPPITLEEALGRMPELATDAAVREQTAALTQRIEQALIDVVHPTESWELHHLMHRTRTLLRAERSQRAKANTAASDMAERRLGFERVWRGYYANKQANPEQSALLLKRVDLYDMELRTLRLKDEELDESPKLFSWWLPVLLAMQAVLVYGFLPPLLWMGYLINAAPYQLLRLISKRASRETKDVASVKMFGGMFLFPLTWLAAAGLAAYGVLNLHARFAAIPERPWLAAISTFALGAVGGFVALRYAELSQETLRALRVRLTRHRYKESVSRLRQERAELSAALEAIASGIDLPGKVANDGRVEG